MKVYLFLGLAVLAWGAVSVIEKSIIDKVNPWAFIFWRWIGLGIAITIILLFSGKFRAAASQPDTGPAVLAMITGLVGWLLAAYFYYKALEIEQVGIVVPYIATFPVVTMILAYFVLREPITVMKLVGTGFIVTGCILLSREVTSVVK